MTLEDITHLRNLDTSGEAVVSWYAKQVWSMRNRDVVDDETALRLSKLMRDNHRNAIRILHLIHQQKNYLFLVYLLNLGYAERRPVFHNFHSANFITEFDRVIYRPDSTKYSIEQKSRRIRIGLDALSKFNNRDGRHTFVVTSTTIENHINEALNKLSNAPEQHLKWDQLIDDAVFGFNFSEPRLRLLARDIPIGRSDYYEDVKSGLQKAMDCVGDSLSSMWNDARYVRTEIEL